MTQRTKAKYIAPTETETRGKEGIPEKQGRTNMIERHATPRPARKKLKES
jgi:hypothetical protein